MFLTTEAQQRAAAPKSWHIAATLPANEGNKEALGVAGPVAGVHHEVLMVGGGANFPGAAPWLGGIKKYYDEVFLFRRNKKGALEGQGAFKLPFPLAYSANVATAKGIVCAGGENSDGLSKKVLLLQWDGAAQKAAVHFLPDLPLALTNAAITSDGSNVYLAGGETAAAAADLFLYLNLEDTSAGWQQLPKLPQPTSHAVLLHAPKEGRIYLVGGRKKNKSGISDLYASVFAFDVAQKQWQQKAPLPYALSAGTGVATASGSLFLLGGDKGETFHKAETLIAAIAHEAESVKKEALNQEKIKVQSTHPGFSNAVLRYDAKEDRWIPAGSIPFAVPVTTTAVKWNDCVLITSGEIKAGVRTPNILAATVR